MTGQEILVYLLNKGVVHKIGDDKYVPTSKVAELTANVMTINTLDIKTPVKPELSSLYPKEIREATENNKVKVLLNICDVPTVWNGPTGTYMLRSADITTNTTMLGKMYDPKVKANLLIRVITDYYANVAYPKALKRFLAEGDFDALYESYTKGDFLTNDDDLYTKTAS